MTRCRSERHQGVEVPVKGGTMTVSPEDVPLAREPGWRLKNVNRPQYDPLYYVSRRNPVTGKTEYFHRVVAQTPPGLTTHHANHDTLDNRRCNLDRVTHARNMQSKAKQRDNTSGYIGVSRHGGRWEAHLRHEGEFQYIGLFETAEEAAHARDARAKELRGDFAVLNFPEG